MPEVNQTLRQNPQFVTQSAADQTAVVGLETYGEGLSHFSKHLANMHTLGYMADSMCHLTQGPNGEQVRGIEMNQFDDQNRGPLEGTNRVLDLAVNGRGFLIVDASRSTDPDSPIQHGMKTTGSFQMDSEGYVYDEAGNTLLGAPIDEKGNVAPFSLMAQLERVQIPMDPGDVSATTQITFDGILPADNVSKGDIKQNAVDVFGSLGVAHQLQFSWTFLGPRLWRLTAVDSEGAKLSQNADGSGPWVHDEANPGGCIVGFDTNGQFAGSVPATETTYQDYETAQRTSEGGKQVLEFIQQAIKTNPTLTHAQLSASATDFRNNTFQDTRAPEYVGADGVLNAFSAETDRGAAETAAVTAQETHINDEKTAHQALESLFSPLQHPPSVYVQDWRNSEGTLLGEANSMINIDVSAYRMTGNDFLIQTPSQDGVGSTVFKGLSVSSSGILSYEFFGQPSKPVWAIPLINFANNNGLEQNANNVLLPTDACGERYILASPLSSTLGSLDSKALMKSNVNPQKTLLGGHHMARATEMNTTLFKIATELNKFVIQMIAQAA